MEDVRTATACLCELPVYRTLLTTARWRCYPELGAEMVYPAMEVPEKAAEITAMQSNSSHAEVESLKR